MARRKHVQRLGRVLPDADRRCRRQGRACGAATHQRKVPDRFSNRIHAIPARAPLPDAELDDFRSRSSDASVIQPVVVRPGKGVQDHSDHRREQRWRAWQDRQAAPKCRSVPVDVRAVTIRLEIAIIENPRHEGLECGEEARLWRADANRFKRRHRDEIAKIVGQEPQPRRPERDARLADSARGRPSWAGCPTGRARLRGSACPIQRRLDNAIVEEPRRTPGRSAGALMRCNAVREPRGHAARGKVEDPDRSRWERVSDRVGSAGRRRSPRSPAAPSHRVSDLEQLDEIVAG